MKLAPYQCKDNQDSSKLNEQGIEHNEYSIEIRPNVVLLKTHDAILKIPMRHFERFARWYLEPQEIETENENNIRYFHDEDADVLYILIGQPIPAEAEPIASGVYVRRSVEDDTIVGAVIENYSEREKSDLDAMLPADIKLGKMMYNL